jgi:hypothetical protein
MSPVVNAGKTIELFRGRRFKFENKKPKTEWKLKFSKGLAHMKYGEETNHIPNRIRNEWLNQ